MTFQQVGPGRPFNHRIPDPLPPFRGPASELPKAGVNLETSTATLQSRSAAAVNQKNEKVPLRQRCVQQPSWLMIRLRAILAILYSIHGRWLQYITIYYNPLGESLLTNELYGHESGFEHCSSDFIPRLGYLGLCLRLALHSLAISCDLLHLLGFGLLTCSWAWLPCSGQLSLQTLPCHVWKAGLCFPLDSFSRAFQDMTWYDMTCHYVITFHVMTNHCMPLHAIALHDSLNEITWYYMTLHYTLHYMTFSTTTHLIFSSRYFKNTWHERIMRWDPWED